jgi:hypothetical protein
LFLLFLDSRFTPGRTNSPLAAIIEFVAFLCEVLANKGSRQRALLVASFSAKRNKAAFQLLFQQDGEPAELHVKKLALFINSVQFNIKNSNKCLQRSLAESQDCTTFQATRQALDLTPRSLPQ